jgi:hypothetical protein
MKTPVYNGNPSCSGYESLKIREYSEKIRIPGAYIETVISAFFPLIMQMVREKYCIEANRVLWFSLRGKTVAFFLVPFFFFIHLLFCRLSSRRNRASCKNSKKCREITAAKTRAIGCSPDRGGKIPGRS